jgi:asparagine synthase (glutamine-hydrolysing)
MGEMSAALSLRGPDDSGEYFSRQCSLVHRRLAVVDPEHGRQPMRKHGGGAGCILTYNGELYNTEEVRMKLTALGHSFAERSDTEVLLEAYLQWGRDCVLHLNGIYAFAVWDESKRELFVARDRIGVKPLFFFKYNDGVVFASELKSLLKNPLVKPIIDRDGAARLLLLSPARRIGDGVFSGVKELKPGEYAVFNREDFTRKTYWSPKATPHTESVEETAAHLRELLFGAITRQLVSDVPLCTFLSGGLDSSIITAVAAKHYKEEGRRFSTYSVDYKGNRENFQKSLYQPDEDTAFINAMTAFSGTKHTNVIIDTDELTEALTPAVIARGLPGMADVDSSLYLFCKEVRKDFTVAVSGECADELFGGYPWYHNDEMLADSGFPWARSALDRANISRQDIIKDIDAVQYLKDEADETRRKADFLGSDTEKDRLMREMFMLNFYWFMQVLLDRKDRMSMANGLEVRVPFCDHTIAEYAYNIPWEMKALNGREKGIMRKAVEGFLPEEVVYRKKSPYPKTHNPAYMNLVTSRLTAVLHDSDCRLTELFNRDKLLQLLETGGSSFKNNWFGQLMSAPQTFAMLLQTETWLRYYNVELNL